MVIIVIIRIGAVRLTWRIVFHLVTINYLFRRGFTPAIVCILFALLTFHNSVVTLNFFRRLAIYHLNRNWVLITNGITSISVLFFSLLTFVLSGEFSFMFESSIFVHGLFPALVVDAHLLSEKSLCGS